MTALGAVETTAIFDDRIARYANKARPRVYLAGPIKGLGYGDATDWRNHAKAELAPEIVCYSPMRGKDYLDTCRPIQAEYPHLTLSNAKAIMARDRNDVMRADLVLANLAGAESVSIGTVMECAWADAFRVPLVVVGREGDLHDHPMIREAAGWTVPDLETACYVARSVLLP